MESPFRDGLKRAQRSACGQVLAPAGVDLIELRLNFCDRLLEAVAAEAGRSLQRNELRPESLFEPVEQRCAVGIEGK
jgi:hypothetical protein